MTDGFPDRITQLRARWQADPSSRVFLQLAEEYRHIGRVQDALAVLESGLKEHPGYLSALVAQGRCLLEVGDAGKARGVLERVVQQDATQMVASKLLVRAYIETNDPERARQRLDLYRLLNDSDPEIEELHRRVVAMSRPPQAPDGPRPEEPAERPRMDSTETPAAEVFDLGPAQPARSPAAEEDLFGLGNLPATLPEAPPAAAPPSTAPPAVAPPGEAPPAALPPPAAVPETPLTAATPRSHGFASYGGSDPFPDPAPEESRRRYLAGFAAEGIFSFAGGAGVEEPGPPADLAATAAAAVTAAAPAEPPAPPAPQTPAAAPPAQPAAAEAPLAPPAPAESRETLTLGELYLRQGHLEEAARIFGEVARRDPGNAAAREALAEIARRAQSARAVRPDAAVQPTASDQGTPAAAATESATPGQAAAAAAGAPGAAILPLLPDPAATSAAGAEPEREPPAEARSSPAMAAEPPATAPAEPPATAAQPGASAPAAAAAAAVQPAPQARPIMPPALTAQQAAPMAAKPPASAPAPSLAAAAAVQPALEPAAAGGPRPRPLDAGQLVAGMADPQAAPTARKAYLLQSYLTRLRQPRSPHVP